MSVVSYLKLHLKPEFLPEFERDLQEMVQLSREQSGFLSVEVLRPVDRDSEYVIISEWESEDAFKAWEHSFRHEEIIGLYEHERLSQRYEKMRLERYR
jgi:heme-degrading monooxygenase HmoA